MYEDWRALVRGCVPVLILSALGWLVLGGAAYLILRFLRLV